MRRKYESGPEPLRGKYAWFVALACIAVAGLTPNAASAQEEEAAAATDAEATADMAESVDADDDVSEEEYQKAQDAIDAAQTQLDEARRQLDMRMPEQPKPEPGTGVGLVASDGRAKKLQVSLNDDGTLYLRFAMWLQVWARAMQMNPGTTILDPEPGVDPAVNEESWYGDVGLRRARFLMFGKIFPRTFMLMHIGMNNQTFRNVRKPQVYFHDAWVEFEASKKGYIDIGGGLLYWNGVSRMTNASTITAMSLDLPIVNWPTIERTDQFARQMGLYAKGKAGLFDWRVAAVRPFSTSVGAPTAIGNYNDSANTWGYSGYLQLQFFDIEPNVLPYTVGTYIGAKRVLNLGGGFHLHPKGIAYLDGGGNVKEDMLTIAAGDLFADIPFKGGGALTAYGVYYYMDFGPNNIRNIGIMNPGDLGSGTSFAGQGNAYPMIGTGHTGYAQLGGLIPGTAGKYMKFQLYGLSQFSWFEALQDPMIQFGAGLNMFIHRHNAKVTVEWRNRPIFNVDGTSRNRKGNGIVLQMHLFI